jgi:hypothetical protein
VRRKTTVTVCVAGILALPLALSASVFGAGAPQWTANGVALRNIAGSDAYYPTITSGGAGGAIVTWYDGRSGAFDIYAQRVNAGGAPQWTANSRKTIRVNDQLPPNTDVSTHVTGSAAIIAERAMYWDHGTGEACHDSIGMAEPHTSFYLPDGQTSEGRETWTLVANPNPSAVTVEVSYLKAGGGADSFEKEIPANSRYSFNMSERIASGRAAVMVVSRTAGKDIMCERAMYWNNRGAGTDTIGGYGN